MLSPASLRGTAAMAQASFTIIDPQTGDPIGNVMVGINGKMLWQLQRLTHTLRHS